MPEMSVKHTHGVASTMHARTHDVKVDAPPQMGGEDTGPTPVELLTGALGSCIVFYVARWAREAGVPYEGMEVKLDYVLDMEAHCVPVINVEIVMPHGFPEDRRDSVMRVAEHCTVHHTLCSPPRITLTLAE